MTKVIYTFFLSIILALFVGIGVSVFYDAPKWPEPPTSVKYQDNGQPVEEDRAEQEEYDRQYKAYQEKDQAYNRNVSVILTIAAVVMLAIGVGMGHKLDVLGDGILLGGVFTLIYAMGRGIASDDEIFRFLVVTVGLLAALGLGWWRFIKPNNAKPKKT